MTTQEKIQLAVITVAAITSFEKLLSMLFSAMKHATDKAVTTREVKKSAALLNWKEWLAPVSCVLVCVFMLVVQFIDGAPLTRTSVVIIALSVGGIVGSVALLALAILQLTMLRTLMICWTSLNEQLREIRFPHREESQPAPKPTVRRLFDPNAEKE